MCCDALLQKVVESAARKEAEDAELMSMIELLSSDQQLQLVRLVQAVAEHSNLFNTAPQRPLTIMMAAIQAAIRPESPNPAEVARCVTARDE